MEKDKTPEEWCQSLGTTKVRGKCSKDLKPNFWIICHPSMYIYIFIKSSSLSLFWIFNSSESVRISALDRRHILPPKSKKFTYHTWSLNSLFGKICKVPILKWHFKRVIIPLFCFSKEQVPPSHSSSALCLGFLDLEVLEDSIWKRIINLVWLK